jgi:hypothetical protein
MELWRKYMPSAANRTGEGARLLHHPAESAPHHPAVRSHGHLQERESRMTRSLAVSILLLAGVACGPRQVEVRTAPASQADVSIHLTNNLAQAVHVYVVAGGDLIFIRQVPARTVEHLPVRGVAPGSTVSLRATTIDGARTFERRNVLLDGMIGWTLTP